MKQLTLLVFFLFGGLHLMANHLTITITDLGKALLCESNPDTIIPNAYLKIVDPKNMWILKGNPIDTHTKSRALRFNNDSIEFKGRYYYELLITFDESGSKWYPVGRYFREDDGKTFEYIPSKKLEVLRYDQNLRVGDNFGPVKVCGIPCQDVMLQVYKIDTVVHLDSLPRKRVHLICNSPEITCYYSWTEGIGDFLDPFSEFILDGEAPGRVAEISCFYSGQKLVYKYNPKGDVECWKKNITKPVLEPLVNLDLVWYIASNANQINSTYSLRLTPVIMSFSLRHEILVRQSSTAKLWERTGFYFSEEEDGVGRFYDTSSRSSIIYNMNLSIGNQIQIFNGRGFELDSFEVFRVDKITLNDMIPRKRISLKCISNPQKIIEWIEGIGSLINPFRLRNHCTAFGDSSRVLCIEKSGQLIYKYNRNEASCWSVGTENKLISKFEIFPNPFYNNMHIAGELPSDGHILISDFLGKIITKISISPNQQQVIFDSGDLVTGIYAIQIFSKHRLLWSGKGVKP